MNTESKNKLKVALVHDWLTGMRGGEKVLELFCRRFPQAPVFTLLHNQKSVSDTIESHTIKSSLLQILPLSKKKYRHYLPLYPLFAELNKVKGADVVISTSHAVAKAMISRRGKKPLHLCYIHTPMRYIWDLFDDYFGKERVGPLLSRFFFKPVAQALQLYDIKTLNRVDLFIANSTFVAKRVKRIYNRDAKILFPPIDLKKFENVKREASDWYLVVTALVPYKKTELAIIACAELNRNLKVIGSGPEEKKLKTLAKKLNAKVDFLGFVSDEELVQYYSKAKALLFPGLEDFGIVPVEALAAGCPVIAYAEGGILDSMTEKTAILYSPGTALGLKGGILKFEKSSFFEEDLKQRAQNFSQDKFLDRFEIIFEEALKEWELEIP